MESKNCSCGTVYADETEQIVENRMLDKIKYICNMSRSKNVSLELTQIKKETKELREKKVESLSEEDDIFQLWENLEFEHRREITDILIDTVYADEQNVMIVWKI
jgi:hypothetical protein